MLSGGYSALNGAGEEWDAVLMGPPVTGSVDMTGGSVGGGAGNGGSGYLSRSTQLTASAIPFIAGSTPTPLAPASSHQPSISNSVTTIASTSLPGGGGGSSSAGGMSAIPSSLGLTANRSRVGSSGNNSMSAGSRGSSSHGGFGSRIGSPHGMNMNMNVNGSHLGYPPGIAPPNSHPISNGNGNGNGGTGVGGEKKKGSGEDVDIAKLRSGEETRSAVMIRNIPNRFSPEELSEILDNYVKGR